MRVTFPRLRDGQRGYALVERDDGAVYRLYGGKAGPRLPHDIMHFVVERELCIQDGIWAAIAAGIIFDTMEHAGGRRPPPARERSKEPLTDFGQRGLRAEVLANFVEYVAMLDHPSDIQILNLAAARLAVLPDADAHMDPAVVAAAAQALQVEAARWARLRVGEELSYEWPRKPRIVRPDKNRKGRRPA